MNTRQWLVWHLSCLQRFPLVVACDLDVRLLLQHTNSMKHTTREVIYITLFSLFSFSASAQEEAKFVIGPALGRDVDAFAKVFHIDLTKPDITEGAPEKPTGYIWFRDVATLGQVKLRHVTENPFVLYLAVRFPDAKVTTWQAAFEKLGLSTEARVSEQGDNFVSISFPTENGRVCEAWFYRTDPEQNTKLPMIEFVIKEKK